MGAGELWEVVEGRGEKELRKLVNEKGCIRWRPARSSLAPRRAPPPSRSNLLHKRSIRTTIMRFSKRKPVRDRDCTAWSSQNVLSLE